MGVAPPPPSTVEMFPSVTRQVPVQRLQSQGVSGEVTEDLQEALLKLQQRAGGAPQGISNSKGDLCSGT